MVCYYCTQCTLASTRCTLDCSGASTAYSDAVQIAQAYSSCIRVCNSQYLLCATAAGCIGGGGSGNSGGGGGES